MSEYGWSLHHFAAFYDKSLIAGRLGLKPESLSRVFAKLRLVGVDVRASDVVVSEIASFAISSPAIESRRGAAFQRH